LYFGKKLTHSATAELFVSFTSFSSNDYEATEAD